jgi:hypothetical protein
MDWEMVSAIVAILALLFGIFMEWPRFRTRLNETRDTRDVIAPYSGHVLIALILIGAVPFFIGAFIRCPKGSVTSCSDPVFVAGALSISTGITLGGLLMTLSEFTQPKSMKDTDKRAKGMLSARTKTLIYGTLMTIAGICMIYQVLT